MLARLQAGEAIDRLVAACCADADAVVRSAWSRAIPADAPLHDERQLACGGHAQAEALHHAG